MSWLPRRAATLAAVLVLVACHSTPTSTFTPTPAPTSAPGYDLAPLSALVQHAVDTLRLEGACLLVAKDGQVVYERAFGRYTLDTEVPIASASKWLSATVIMSLVDEGRIGLDEPLSSYLPSFAGLKGTITMRQLLSHRSGLATSDPCLDDRSITLAQCADRIAGLGLAAGPGTHFLYGGLSYQVAGRVAEVAGGGPWAALFQERLAGPLGMAHTRFEDGQNPVIGGGARSTVRDYASFLQMLLNGGAVGEERILSSETVREMHRDQTHGVPIGQTLHPDGRRYGLGVWRDIVDEQGNAVQLSSQGDTGFSPWIDLQRNLLGVFMVDDRLGNVRRLVEDIQQTVRDVVDSAAPTGLRHPSTRQDPAATGSANASSI